MGLGPLWLGVAAPAKGQSGGTPQPPPTSVKRQAAPLPIEWSPIARNPFVSRPGNRWIVIEEAAVTGVAIVDGKRRELRQTRIRLAQDTAYGEADVAIVMHVDNLHVEVFEPEDDRLFQAPTVSQNPENPWPNTCGLSFQEQERAIDVNWNDRMELVLKFYATCPMPGTSGLVLIDENDEGMPRRLDLSEVVGGVDLPELVLTRIGWPPHNRSPLLFGEFLPLTGCRFLAQLEIRGESLCRDCCDMPIIFSEGPDRRFHPGYVREEQGGYLDRLRNDIALVSGRKESGEPLAAEEQAALARMASFFFLTGNGPGTRLELEKALGPRAEDYRTQVLLERLESYFLEGAR